MGKIPSLRSHLGRSDHAHAAASASEVAFQREKKEGAGHVGDAAIMLATSVPFPGTHFHSVLAWPADSSAVRAVDAVSAIAKATKIRTAHRGIPGNDGQ